MKNPFSSRPFKLLGMATQLGGHEIGRAIREQFTQNLEATLRNQAKTRFDQAKIIAENLGQMKGAAMKAGQLLSLDLHDFFPPEAIELLNKLQSQAEPFDWEEIETVLFEELGRERLQEFSRLEEVPAAAASIGQVHRGRLSEKRNHQEVAVKIQYPGVVESIDSDLKLLQTIAGAVLSISGRQMNLQELFAEFTEVLKRETDYGLEAESMRRYGELIQPYSSDYTVPDLIPDLSTRRVLTMSWQHGISLPGWIKLQPERQKKERIARLVLDLYCREFFAWGLVQTDPNLGNFLIQDEADGLKLVVLDFGATLSYDQKFQAEYVAILRALASLDRQKIVRQSIEFGLLDPRESQEACELYCDFLLQSIEPFQPRLQPFRFKDADFTTRSREMGRRFTNSLKYSAPPRKIIFLHRKLAGIFSLLKKLDIEIDLRPYWEKMVG